MNSCPRDGAQLNSSRIKGSTDPDQGATTKPAKKNGFEYRHQYRPEIDGLRAFAVLAVIINHVNNDILPSGYLGVDIFFVISGYVITSSLANRRAGASDYFFWDFTIAESGD